MQGQSHVASPRPTPHRDWVPLSEFGSPAARGEAEATCPTKSSQQQHVRTLADCEGEGVEQREVHPMHLPPTPHPRAHAEPGVLGTEALLRQGLA